MLILHLKKNQLLDWFNGSVEHLSVLNESDFLFISKSIDEVFSKGQPLTRFNTTKIFLNGVPATGKSTLQTVITQ